MVDRRGFDNDFDPIEGNMDNDSLVAYRLGRVEKAVEVNNKTAIERDDKILSKLESIDKLNTLITGHEIRLTNLENWRKGVVAYLIALSLVIIPIVYQLVSSK